MSVRPISSLERLAALPITAISLAVLIFAIIAIVNSDASSQLVWVYIVGYSTLYGALPLGTILIYLGASLKMAGDSITRYGVVIGTGAAMILFWFLVWGTFLGLFASFG